MKKWKHGLVSHMIRVSLSPDAEKDLIQIKSYIADELDSPAAANRVLAEITKRIGKLADFPEIGPTIEAIVSLESEYRVLVCGNYLAFYLLEENMVLIDRILYGKRDFVRILFDEISDETQ